VGFACRQCNRGRAKPTRDGAALRERRKAANSPSTGVVPSPTPMPVPVPGRQQSLSIRMK